MHKRPIVIAMLLLMLPALGCQRFKARIELKQGNSYYENEDYTEALAQFQRGLELDPTATFAWRSVGLAALALFRPGEESAKNQQIADTAIDAFEKYLADYPEDNKVEDYLLSTYVNAKRYEKAIEYLDRKAGAANDPQVQKYKINVLTKAGQFEEAAKLAMQYRGPDRAEALYTIGVTAWDKSYNDPALSLEERNHVVDLGLEATKTALDLKPDYFEAMAYYNLLFREKAKMEIDAVRRQQYVDQANEWMQKAIELRKKTAPKPEAAAAPAGT